VKTAVSIPDDLFRKAEKAAKKRNLSRSKLYALALRFYLQGDWREEATRRANALADTVDTSMPPAMDAAIAERMREVEW
jgi:metal-responsive CopG/Arc/MetJ family transcriptional regulator